MLIDASEPITEQDLRVISMVVDAGRALVIAFNKWDLSTRTAAATWSARSTAIWSRVPWAPRVNISARTGRAVRSSCPPCDTALESWEQRIPTGRLNTWLSEVVAAHPAADPRRQQPRSCSRPRPAPGRRTFVLFTTGFLEAGYRRFLERRLREEFGFVGTPIGVSVRVREKRERRSADRRPDQALALRTAA